MMALAGAAASLSGFAALALSMPKHQRDTFGAALSPRRRHALRFGGWALVILSLLLTMTAWGAAMGTVFWCGTTTVSALAVAMALYYRPRAILPAGIAILFLALDAAALGGSV
jgi:hypothetical protein